MKRVNEPEEQKNEQSTDQAEGLANEATSGQTPDPDPEYSAQMKAAREIMRRYADTLRRLADS